MRPVRTVLVGTESARVAMRRALDDCPFALGVDEGERLEVAASSLKEGRADLILLAPEGELGAWLKGIEQLLADSPAAGALLVGAPLDVREMGLAMQAGIREVLPTLEPEALRAAVQRAATFLARLHGAHRGSEPVRMTQGQLVVVHAPKGGSGKSTLAVNLALALALEGADGVALVEVSPQSSELDLLLNLKPALHLSDLARLGSELEAEAIDQALVRHASGLELLASAPNPEEGELIDRGLVERVVQDLRRRRGWVVMDTPPALSEGIVRALELADRVLIPFFPDLASLRHLQQSLRLWAELGIDGAKIVLVGWGQPSEVDESAIARILRRPLGWQLPYAPEAALAAVNAGKPMVLTPSPFGKALRGQARQWLGMTPAERSPHPWALLGSLGQRLRRIDVPAQST